MGKKVFFIAVAVMLALYGTSWAGTQVTKINKYDMYGKYQVFTYSAAYPSPADYWGKDIVVWYLPGTDLSETTRLKVNKDGTKDEGWSMVLHGDVKICEKGSGGGCVFPPPGYDICPCCEGDLVCYEWMQDYCPPASGSMMSIVSGPKTGSSDPVICDDAAALYIGPLKVEQNVQDDSLATACVTPGSAVPVTFGVDGVPDFTSCVKPLGQFDYIMHHWKLRGNSLGYFYSVQLKDPFTACVKTERGEKCFNVPQ